MKTKYEISQALFWKVAVPEEIEPSGKVKLTKAKSMSVDRIRRELTEIHSREVELFAELRDIYVGMPDEMSCQAATLFRRGSQHSKYSLELEQFSQSELKELNDQGVLSKLQHELILLEEPEFLPLELDAMLSRRQVQKITQWSNDKLNRLANLPKWPLPVFEKATTNGQSDKYSAIAVYRWLILQRVASPDLITNWDGDLSLNGPKVTIFCTYGSTDGGAIRRAHEVARLQLEAA